MYNNINLKITELKEKEERMKKYSDITSHIKEDLKNNFKDEIEHSIKEGVKKDFKKDIVNIDMKINELIQNNQYKNDQLYNNNKILIHELEMKINKMNDYIKLLDENFINLNTKMENIEKNIIDINEKLEKKNNTNIVINEEKKEVEIKPEKSYIKNTLDIGQIKILKNKTNIKK